MSTAKPESEARVDALALSIWEDDGGRIPESDGRHTEATLTLPRRQLNPIPSHPSKAIMMAVTPNTITEHRSLEWFQPNERELTRHNDPEKIRLLGEDMLTNGQLQAVAATEGGPMIFGHGRFLAAKMVGIKTLETKLFPASLSPTQFKLIRASENLQRNELTGYRKWLLCVELQHDNPIWQLKELAEHLHLDPSMITRLLSPSKCIEAVQVALREGKIGISDCYELSLSPERQAELLALKLGGASRSTIKEARRKSTKPAKDRITLSRVKIELPKGVSVVVSGANLGMAEVVQHLSDSLTGAKKAAEQFDVKTFQSMMKDKAKKG